MSNLIRTNDTVRSFDFEMLRELEGPEACYVEGVVECLKDLEGCPRYDIRVTRLGRITDGVFKIEEAA